MNTNISALLLPINETLALGETAFATISPVKKTRTWLAVVAAAIIGILAPCLASAALILSIDEGISLPNPLMTEGTLGLLTQNFTLGNDLGFAIVQETATSLGIAQIHFEFFSSSAPAADQTTINNTNFVDGSVISDTVSVLLTGHPLDTNGNNVRADILFQSGSLDDSLLPLALPNAATFGENGFYNLVATGVPVEDLNFSVRSDLESNVPEPGTIGLALLSMCAGRLFLKRSRKAREVTA